MRPISWCFGYKNENFKIDDNLFPISLYPTKQLRDRQAKRTAEARDANFHASP